VPTCTSSPLLAQSKKALVEKFQNGNGRCSAGLKLRLSGMVSIHVNFGRTAVISFSFFFSESGSRYDCECDKWNHCYEFNFAENARACGWEPIDNDDDENNNNNDEYTWGGGKHTCEVEGSQGVNKYVQRVDEPPQGDKGHRWGYPLELWGATGDYVWNFDTLNSWGTLPLPPNTNPTSHHSEHPTSSP
jgi:hypothetical protein